jgi:repressor LexA
MYLSARQQAVYRFIEGYLQENGLPPTTREIGHALGLSSTSHVSYLIGQLEKKGLLERVARTARGLRLRQGGIAVQGYIAAGQPLEIFEAPDQLLDLPLPAAQGRRLFALQVKGQSMIEDHIEDGDYVLIDPDAAIEQGDIVVACECGTSTSERGAATLKRIFKEPHQIELRPANSSMTSRFISAEEWERHWRLQGKVRAIYRSFELAGSPVRARH